MSLTTFIELSDVRDHFNECFQKPSLPDRHELKAPPCSKRYRLVGTAFDYLLRFLIKRINPFSIEQPWTAEISLKSPMSPILKDAVHDLVTGEADYTETALTNKVKGTIDAAKYESQRYISTAEISTSLLESVLRLAQIDPIVRSGYIDPDLGTIHAEDVDDLERLISLVEERYFKASKVSLLNPTFGKASRLVGGADSDILIDDQLIEIKTVQKFELQPHFYRQLIGYVVLNELSAIGDLKPQPKINTAGIYYSRHGFLFSFRIDELIKQDSFKKFVDWFRQRAEMDQEKFKGKLSDMT